MFERPMDFRVLGPLEVRVGECQLALGGPKQRTLLALLLLRANRVASQEWLVDGLWDQAPPATAVAQIQALVSRLRRLVGRERVLTQRPGYLLRVESGELDLALFEEQVAEARQAQEAGRLDGAAAGLQNALGLWRGAALGGATGPVVDAEAARLEELRLAALEARIEVDLERGRDGELVAELTGLVAGQPFRERLRGLLMVALYRAGRQADALAVHREGRRVLADELGLEPGRWLQQLERQVLAGDPALELQRESGSDMAVGPPSVPRQLPPDVGAFTGRAAEVAEVARVLEDAAPGGPVVISAIEGAGGIGKSALAVHVAHRVAERFPDGQLYVNLQGASAGMMPLEPLEVLGRFLRTLGVDGSGIPSDVDEAAGKFRSQVADKAVLVVLDNASDAAQVAPLLPASASCGVLVTSRRALTGLEGAGHVQLDVLSDDEAMALLSGVASAQRVAREPEAAGTVAKLCGWLPLALRIAGARLAARPHWPIATLAERLADEDRRLDELQLAETGVRASVAVSWQQLAGSTDAVDRAAVAALPILGMLDGPDVGVPVADRLLDQPDGASEVVLERLVDANLLESPLPGRYRLHDLLRLYAREQATTRHSEVERAAALTRALGFYVTGAWQTLGRLRPGDYRLRRMDDRWRDGRLELPDEQAALSWLETERDNLLAAVAQAASLDGPASAIAVQLAHAMFGLLWVRSYWDEMARVNETAVGVAARLGDRASEAQALNDLGGVRRKQGRYEEASAYIQQSLTAWREVADRHGEAAALNNLALLHEKQGRYHEALACHEESLSIRRDVGDRHGQAISLGNLGNLHEKQGRFDEALACHQQALASYRELGDRHGQAICLGNLGVLYRKQGQYDESSAYFDEGLTAYADLGDRYGHAHCLYGVGLLYREQYRFGEALARLERCLAVRRELGDPYVEAETLRELGVTLLATNRHNEAQRHLREALEIFEQLHSPDADGVRAMLEDEFAGQDR
jgi:DNA-binding SARP family transcriptional activator/tetratricopeptide (TPR) repeat protein